MIFSVKLPTGPQELPHVSTIFHSCVSFFLCENFHVGTTFPKGFPQFQRHGAQVAALQLLSLRAQRGARALGGARRGAAEAAAAAPGRCQKARCSEGWGEATGWAGWVGGNP